MFLAQPEFAASSCRSYAQTLGRLGHELLGLSARWSGSPAASSSGPSWTRGVAARQRHGTPCGHGACSRRSVCAVAGWPSRLPRPWRAGASPPTGPGRSRTPSSSGCGVATTSRCARRRCGPAVVRDCGAGWRGAGAGTSKISTSRTSAPARSPRAGTAGVAALAGRLGAAAAASTGHTLRDEDIERLNPLGHEHITLTGRYRIALPEPLREQGAYRPLKTPTPDAAA